jgi:hypothetical protein
MKMLRTVSAALLVGATLSAAPVLAQSIGSFAGPSGGSAGAAMGSGAVGSFQSETGRGDRFDRSGWLDDRTWRDGRPDRRERRERRLRRGWYSYGVGIGISSGSTLDREGGYFAEGAQPPIVENGQAQYAYDRGYPYDHFASIGNEARGQARYSSAERSCETEWTRDRRTNGQVAVRVCRN